MMPKGDIVTVRCKNCHTPLQIPVGGKRLCACGHWVAAPTTAPADEPAAAASPMEVRPPVATSVPPAIPTAVPAASPAAGGWPRIEGDLSAIERLNEGYRRITKELNKVIVGQSDVIEQLLIAIFAKGDCLLVGVPGLAK